MEPGTDLDEACRAIRHRIDGHRAALAAAVALGQPPCLAVAVTETEARLAEARACLAAVHVATARVGS